MNTETATFETLEGSSRTGLVIHGSLAKRESADHLVCFMPSAQATGRPRNPRQLSRMTWEAVLPKQHVMALADPAMGLDDEILACWYLHPTADLLEEMARMVRGVSLQLGLKNEQVLFYGSSLGGFGAIAMASLLPGSSAIAEVPQIDVARWPKPHMVRAMEEKILGMPFAEFRISNPHMVDLRDRFKKSGLVPSFLLVTNEGDVSLDLQKDFMDSIDTSDLPKLGTQEIILTSKVSGHGALSRGLVISLIEKWCGQADFGAHGWAGLEAIA